MKTASQQVDLFGEAPRPLEVHEHSIVSGPRAQRGECITHSHVGGDRPHQHPHTGPGAYTIDRDDWRRATGGGAGGGRKRFTDTPDGEQLPIVELEEWQKSFEVHFTARPNPFGEGVTGGGDAAAARMVLAFRMRCVVDNDAPPARESEAP